MDLDAMKYAEMRQLAKSVGLKANVKGNNIASDDAQVPEEAAAEPKAVTDSLVTTRRGKKLQTKRKHSGDGADLNPIPFQDDTELPREEEENCGSKRSSKRRKVSSPEVIENKPESAEDDVVIQESKKGMVAKTAGKIPRHEGLMKKKAALRPTTPNFKKLHEAHFSKMESIDSYVQRKNKQVEGLRNTVKDLKAQSETGIKKSAETKTRAMPRVHRVSLFSPGVQEKKTQKRRVTQAPARKSVMKESGPFRPSILSTNKINVRFSQATQDNEHKRSLIKTPARMSPAFPLTPVSGRKSEVRVNKNATSVNKTPGLTPFVFNSTSDTPATNKKNTFDLKASLSRPLTYKPHKGKLKPFSGTQENSALNTSQALPSHQKNYKQHQVQTRAERRVKQTEDRKQKREKMLGARRGLVMA
ncbi:nucleolar and spindle-associated protein 1 [Silurus asotus]|uniref:Nucleolar and spindle-associated protein 1 n=1 Tax=Silurus asotus TaxID=30991 RepID=A0AAD5A8C6_SILAS|nr:nucleolar and spindle-associated protein 1 [Silurus asotus]